MKDWTGRRYWLVGASDGLGAALAGVLSRAGIEVIVSARSEDKLRAVVDGLPGKASYNVMDVADDASVARAAAAVGPVDGVIWLAGVYWPMSARNWQPEQATTMADINFTGALRVLGHVVPGMVARDAGHVVIIGSLSGFRGLPGAIGYGASKAATMSLAESMHYDLRRTGVRVQLANPGFIRTRLTDKNQFKMPAIMEPEDAAREIFELMNTQAFSKSFPRVFSWVFRLSQFLPNGLYYRMFS